jgi:TonB-like protein
MIGLTLLACFAGSASGQTEIMVAPPLPRQESSTDATAPHDAPPASCPVTLPSDGRFVPPAPLSADPKVNLSGLGENQFWFGSQRLWTMLPIDGIWRPWQVPSRPGDFAYSNKLPWGRLNPPFSRKDGPLTITGKRLDGPAPRFTETEESSGFGRDYASGGIMGGFNIPVSGCWQVTGHYKDQDLSFTVWVARPPEQKAPSRVSSSSLSSSLSSASAGEQQSGLTAPPRRIYVDPETQAKSLMYKVTPEIPHEADAANASGVVVLHAVIGKDGRPHELEYISGPALVAQAAMDAVRWWQYRVEMVGDEVFEVDTTIEVAFPPSKE